MDSRITCATISTRGFTLLEVLISILMVSLVMTTAYAVLYTTLGARDHIQKENLESKIGPAILNLIENDISAAWCWNIHENDVFKGESRVISGERADFFHFLTTTNSSFAIRQRDQAVRSDLTEVSYVLRQNPVNPELLELWRRQDFHIDEEIAEGGVYELIYSRIKAFQITYFSDLWEDAERLDDWDASKRGRFPAAMEILMVMEIDPTLVGYHLDEMQRRRLEYRRVVFFPRASQLTMAVRPVVPTFIDPDEADDGEEDGGGAGGAGGGGGGGNDGFSGRFGGDGDDPPEGGGEIFSQGPGGGKPPPPPDGGLGTGRFPQGAPEDIDIEELLELLGK
jgi:prepilin-type N-terminal cleavage/methylation domain-containing protein